jgi:VIT1/CCC1 family predicted Fe2+/Mn2+ transporter
MDAQLKDALLREQRNEITGHLLYARVARRAKSEHNRRVLERIVADELKHYGYLKGLTGRDVPPHRARLWFFSVMGALLGLSFTLKLLEAQEESGLKSYAALLEAQEGLAALIAEEGEHEKELIGMLDEDRLKFIGAIVLGLNDALVELTGALAGFTFAFQNARLIALTGVITGISASFSMAASEYLSAKQERHAAEALRSAAYTGVTYIVTVLFLTLPFLLIGNPFASLSATLGVAVLIIGLFNYYVAVVREERFGKRFLEMVAISLGVAALSFVVGIVVKQVFGIEI